MSAPERFVLDSVTGPELLGDIHRALDRFWTQHREVPVPIRIAVATGVAEIGANIVQYAAGERPVPVRMDIEVSRHQVKVVFTDEGEAARVDLEALRAPDPMAKRGRGLALASAVLDELCYHRHRNCNQWTLISRSFG